MPRRTKGIVTALGLQAVALVLAHDLVFLARYGSRYNEALVHSGHGEAWSSAVGTILAIAAALVVAGVLRIAYLGILVRRADTPTPATELLKPPRGALQLAGLARLWLRIGPRTAITGVVLLTIQENLERSSAGGGIAGPGILLSPEYPFGLWITFAVGLLVGFVAALLEWRRCALLARLRAARARPRRQAEPRAARPRTVGGRPSTSVLGRRSGLRAPPLPSAT